MFLVVNVISFIPLDQQLLRFSPLDHFEEGNLRSGLIELLPSFAIAM